MGGFCGVISKEDCVADLFFGTDYHSHLGTQRGGMAVLGVKGFQRAIHNIQNAPFRSKFENDFAKFEGRAGIGVISDTDPQPLIVASRLGTYALSYLYSTYGSWKAALAAYETNRGIVDFWLANPDNLDAEGEFAKIPDRKTAERVARIEEAMEAYKNLYYQS